MARATLVLPDILHESVGASRLRVEGRTIRAALEDAFRREPALRMHLADESGGLRGHILCFHNGANAPSLDRPLVDGDEIAIFQAISGG